MTTLVVHPGKRFRCDVCSAVITHSYDYDTGQDIVLQAWEESGPRAAPDLVFERYWGLCRECALLVDDGNFKGLLERAIDLNYTADQQLQRQMLTELYSSMERHGMAPCFHCDVCHKVSYNPHDRENRYCGNCHEFY